MQVFVMCVEITKYNPTIALEEMCNIRVIVGSNAVDVWNKYIANFNIGIHRLYLCGHQF